MTDAPPELEALRAALVAAEVRADAMAQEAARARAVASGAEALIAMLRLEIEKLRRALYGQRSERQARLLDQLELQLEELEATASEDDLAAEQAAPRTKVTPVAARRHPARKPFPEHRARASGWWSRRRAPARPAARAGSSSSERTSPRPWRSCPAAGR